MTSPAHPRRFGIAAAAFAVTLALAACAGADAPAATPRPVSPSASITPTVAPAMTTDGGAVGDAARAIGAEVVAYSAPDGAELARFANPIPSGAPLVFHVEEESGPWLRVQLAMRPNGTTGWIRAADVRLATLEYSLEISTANRTLTVLRNGTVQNVYDAAIGTGDTPTPTGRFAITELLEPVNTGYGPYAYGISAFSEVLNSFGGGPGQIGIHGTDDESTVGAAVSHGCVRLTNEAITTLAALLPLGTPVTIS